MMFKDIRQLFGILTSATKPDPIPTFDEWLEVNDSTESQCWEDAVSEYSACRMELEPQELVKDVRERCYLIYQRWVRENFEMG